MTAPTTEQPKPQRCRAKNVRTGERCSNRALDGKPVCQGHVGSLKAPQVRRKADRERVKTDLERFVEPISADDPLYSPPAGLQHEYAATQGRIRWLRDALSRLETAEDLIWGLTKEERIAASETPGTDRTYEARVNVLLDLERAERKHLLEVEKLLASNAFIEAELVLMRRYVETAFVAVSGALKRLGIDPSDPEVQEALNEALLDAEPSREPLALPPNRRSPYYP